MLAKGNIFVPFPIFVFPSMFTWEYTSTSSSISTFGPIIVYGPIFAFLEMTSFALKNERFVFLNHLFR